jgi:flagellar basal-body rod modification protein FlgD
MTTTTAPAATTTTGTSSTDASLALGKANLAQSFNTFLTLLTTQLKNQDPTSPLDSNQFTQQLVQMTGVEQQLASNDLLKQLVTNTGSGMSQAVSVIGKQVTSSSPNAQLTNGKAAWNYNLSRAATSVKLEIVDSSGNVVHAESAKDNSAGNHTLNWNGKDLSGVQLPDGGPYTLKVTATDSTGTAVPATTFQQGVVTGVEQAADGTTTVTMAGAKVPWSTVTSVTNATSTSTTATGG